MLDPRQQQLNARSPDHFAGLSAVIVNGSLKRNPEDSHTRTLLDRVEAILHAQRVAVEHLHLAALEIPPGIYPDMTQHGWPADPWPRIWPTVRDADICVIGTPLWLGEESSLTRVFIERLYAMSGELNDRGQSIFYGKVGGAVITGNEDGVKHTAMSLLYAMSHVGYTIPPQADCGWIGEIGPGPSYGDPRDDGSHVGFDNEFTIQNTTIMTWNLLHLAHLLRNGIPRHGNDREAWEALGSESARETS